MKPLAEWTEAELLRDVAIIFPVEADHIAWDLAPIFRLETVELLGLTPDEIVRVAVLMQTALRDMRELVHVAVAELAVAHRKLSQRHNDDGRSLLPEASASTPDRMRSRAADEQNDIK